MQKIVAIFLLTLVLGCKKKSKTAVDVSKISVEVKIKRFDIDFYKTTLKTLPETKKKYPMLFPHNVDSVWINKINDKDEKQLFLETQKLYKNFSSQEKKIENLFKHIKYYNPNFIEPIVITMLTNMDSRVLYANNYLFISLDNFLGKNHVFYADFPKYMSQNNTKSHLIVDVAKAFINQQTSINKQNRFLDKILFEGKKMYLLDAYLPNVSDTEKIGYSSVKMDWASLNEENIWRYFIEKDLLYSTDTKLNQRFIDVAPFSKFYLENDNNSPGQIGVYIGWKIVRSFMNNNDVSLQELMRMSADEILKKSKYKPRK